MDKKHTDIEKARVSQLLSYMADCQQGIRDLNVQIATMLTVISTLLTLFIGYSVVKEIPGDNIGYLLHLDETKGPLDGRIYQTLNSMITIRRINFWLTTAIILIGVLYIICLEMEKTLRFEYSQHIADRLHDLIPGTKDDIDRNALVTYQQFAETIRNNNPFYVDNSYNLFNVFSVYLTGGLAGIICLITVAVQFILIKDIKWYDWLTVATTVLIILLVGVLFIRFIWKTDNVCDMAYTRANQKLEVRKGLREIATIKERAKNFRMFLLYLLYPRKSSALKMGLIVLGYFAAGSVYGSFYILPLVYILIVFEFLLYQSRYQFNDLRGLNEDPKYTEDRLVNYAEPQKPVRIIAAVVLFIVRFSLGIILILFLGREIVTELLICAAALLIVTIAYEVLRKINFGPGVIIGVGAGFPLRVFSGALAADWRVVWLCWDYQMYFWSIVLVLWLWGITIALMAWTRNLERLVKHNIYDGKTKFPKEHYNIIYSMIENRLTATDKESSVLGIEGRLKDLWNWPYWVILFVFFLFRCDAYRSLNYYHPILFKIDIIIICSAALITVLDYDHLIIVWKWCMALIAINIYIWCYYRRLRINLPYYMLLSSILLSICIMKYKKIKIRVGNPITAIVRQVFGEKVVEMIHPKEVR